MLSSTAMAVSYTHLDVYKRQPLSQEIQDIVPQKNPSEKVVTFLGRITMQKGPEYFVEAAARCV